VPSSPSASPSRTGPLTTGPNVRPGEKPPTFPPQSRERTENGALQFAGYYFKAYDWGYATNDPYLVQQISLPSCKGCQVYVRGLQSLQKTHQTLTGGRIRIRSAQVLSGRFRVKADYAVDVAVDEQPVVLHGGGRPTKTVAPRVTDDHSVVFVSWRAGAWTVVEVTAR
jgi:hypothetical protein